MYIIGQEHPLKHRAIVLCREFVAAGKKLISDAEVIQKILHRCNAIQRMDAIQPCLQALYAVVDEILPITEQDALHAKDLMLSFSGLSARDAIHVAVMESKGVHEICSFDTGFDRISQLHRLS